MAQFIDLYPTDMDTNTLSDLSLRRMFCDFLASSLLTMLAREEDVIEDQVESAMTSIFLSLTQPSCNSISEFANM